MQVTGSAPPSAQRLTEVAAIIDRWAAEQLADNPAVVHVEYDGSDGRRWFIRLHGEAKTVFSVWFHLRQRSLWVETYFMPAPVQSAAEVFEHLLRRNAGLVAFAFCIGDEDAVYLRASLPVELVDEVELDRLLGSAYRYTEECFAPAMRLGFGDRFTG